MLCLFTSVLLCSYCCGNPNKSADAKSESGKQAAAAGLKTAPWFKFDDEIVTRVTLKEVLDAEAYIIM
jgi:hypothetical protein